MHTIAQLEKKRLAVSLTKVRLGHSQCVNYTLWIRATVSGLDCHAKRLTVTLCDSLQLDLPKSTCYFMTYIYQFIVPATLPILLFSWAKHVCTYSAVSSKTDHVARFTAPAARRVVIPHAMSRRTSLTVAIRRQGITQHTILCNWTVADNRVASRRPQAPAGEGRGDRPRPRISKLWRHCAVLLWKI